VSVSFVNQGRMINKSRVGGLFFRLSEGILDWVKFVGILSQLFQVLLM
jgi:hypothetical protein